MSEATLNIQEDMLIELKQAYVRERVQETGQLAKIPRDFYKQVNDWLIDAGDVEREEIQSLLLHFVRIRLGKILNHSNVIDVKFMQHLLADEEIQLWEYLRLQGLKFQKEIFTIPGLD